MRFSIALLGILLIALGATPCFSNPVFVHARTHKAKKHKVPKHRTVQG
jgi:hypothetical protein